MRHPHHYADSVEEFRGKTLLDIGSAEGFTALDTIEVTRFVYLFEYEDKWIEALQATFEPWKEKTMIVKKYISDHDDDVNAALDNFLKDKSRKDLLKNGYRRCGMYGFTGLYGIIRESGSLGFRDLYVS